MGVIHINVRKLNKERKMQQRKQQQPKQQGRVQGTGGALILFMAALGAFWLCVGLGVGWMIWH